MSAGRAALADGGMTGLCRACAKPVLYEGASWCSGTCRQVERDCRWALMREKGDFRAKRWARARLSLDDKPEEHVATTPAGHTCGWALIDGTWVCRQDFYAVGFRHNTSCGAVWGAPSQREVGHDGNLEDAA